VTTRQHKFHSTRPSRSPDLCRQCDRMNQILIEHLDPTAWKAKPPGKARTIAAIFTPCTMSAPSGSGLQPPV